jgi:outer membrane immunogenic protein
MGKSMKMHRIALLAFTLTSVAALASANAADMYVAPPAGPGGYKDGPIPYVSWTGFYVGATAGGAWGDSKFFDTAVSNPFDINGFTGGGEIGYNLQFRSNWVAGLEADISSGPSGKFGPGNLGQPGGGHWGCSSGPCQTDVSWYGTVRGRLGYAYGNALVYGTGGLAYGHVHSGIDNTTDFQVTNTNVGWTAGGGVEYMFAPNWSGKVEYLRVDLGWTPEPLAMKSGTEFNVVRAGVNYHIGSIYEPLK